MDRWWDAMPTKNLRRSLVAERKSAIIADAGGGTIVLPPQTVSLINWQADEETVGVQRVTLQPVRRSDGTPAFVGAAADIVATPIVPGNPAGWIRRTVTAAENIIIEPLRGFFGHITWGVAGVAPSEIVCDWPAAGASFDVLCTRLTVDVILPQSAPVPAGLLGGVPAFAAEVGPSDPVNRRYDQLTYSETFDESPIGVPFTVAVPWYAQSVRLAWRPAGGSYDPAVDSAARVFVTWNHVNGNPIGPVGASIFTEMYPLVGDSDVGAGAAEFPPAAPYDVPVPQAAGSMTLQFVGVASAQAISTAMQWRLSL